MKNFTFYLNILILGASLIFAGCSNDNSKKPSTTPDKSDSTREVKKSTPNLSTPISITSLDYDDSILEGEIKNNSDKAYLEVVLEVTWTTPCGSRILMVKKFPVVPGKDNKIFGKKMTKHFKYRARLHWEGGRPPKIIGKIVSTKVSN